MNLWNPGRPVLDADVVHALLIAVPRSRELSDEELCDESAYSDFMLLATRTEDGRATLGGPTGLSCKLDFQFPRCKLDVQFANFYAADKSAEAALLCTIEAPADGAGMTEEHCMLIQEGLRKAQEQPPLRMTDEQQPPAGESNNRARAEADL